MSLIAWLNVAAWLCYFGAGVLDVLMAWRDDWWPRILLGWAVLNVALLASGLFLHDSGWAGCNAGSAAVALWFWWSRRRGGRKRADGLIGAKSRALRDALVRRAKEAAQPRPVFGPVPGRAG